jgi:adenosine/AMP kinase
MHVAAGMTHAQVAAAENRTVGVVGVIKRRRCNKIKLDDEREERKGMKR